MVNLTAKNPKTAEKEKNLPGSERMEREFYRRPQRGKAAMKFYQIAEETEFNEIFSKMNGFYSLHCKGWERDRNGEFNRKEPKDRREGKKFAGKRADGAGSFTEGRKGRGGDEDGSGGGSRIGMLTSQMARE